MKALMVIPGDSPVPVEADFDTLEVLQEFVGGNIESVVHPFGDDVTVYVNEDGKGQGLPRNGWMTEALAGLLLPGDQIVGPALIVGVTADGEDVGLTQEAALEIDPTLGHLSEGSKESIRLTSVMRAQTFVASVEERGPEAALEILMAMSLDTNRLYLSDDDVHDTYWKAGTEFILLVLRCVLLDEDISIRVEGGDE